MSTPLTRSSRNLVRLTPLCALALGAWLFGACGGRAESVTQASGGAPAAGGAPASAGASPGRAGAGQAGGPVSVAGAPGAGAPGAGAPGAGAPGAGAGGQSNICDNIACPDIVCADGSQLVVPAGACCATCQPTCKQVCASCPIDTHEQMQPGACCPTCVPDKQTVSCPAGKMQYEVGRAQMVEKYSHGCNADSECLVMTVANACENCRPVALWSVVAMNFSSNTSSDAQIECAACPPIAIPPCLPPPPPVCIDHNCELSVP